MSKVPEKVKRAFNALKQEYGHIYLKQLKANYYVYKQTYEWQQEKKSSRTISEYLGKITPDGVFVKRTVSYKDEFEKAKAIIAAHGGEITWNREKWQLEKPILENQEIKVKDTDLRLLMALSMNARMPISKLAKVASTGEQATYSRIKALESKLGINYLIEIDVEKLGYLTYLILIKFENDAPTIEEITKAIVDEPRIQFAVGTKGDYDIIMYIVDENPLKAHDNLIKLRQKEPFNKYRAFWTLTYFAQAYSFMPIRNAFIEKILKERVWRRTKENPHRQRDQLKFIDFVVLKELNTNSAYNFTYIDQKYGLNKGASRYAYQELIRNGIINRPTISMTKLPIKYVGVIVIQNIYYKDIRENRYKYLLDEIEYGKIANKYSLAGNVGAPTNGGISFLPITEEGNLERVSMDIEKELRGSIVKSLVVTSIILGNLCYRRFDNEYSRQYKLLIEFKKLEPKQPIVY